MSLDVFHLSHACSLLIKPHYSRRHQCASINMFRWMEEWNTKAWNAVYNSSRYCHCVEEPLMQNMSQLWASCIKMHMNHQKYKVKVAPLLRNNFRHLVTAQINKAGCCNWLEFDRLSSNPSKLTGTIETDPFWCTRCCQWGLGTN